jgi:hypothetical protein
MKAIPRIVHVAVLALAAFLVHGCEGFIDTRAEYETFTDSRTVGDFEELSVAVDFGVGNFDLSQSVEAGQLHMLDLEYDRLHYEPELDFSEAGGLATLRFELDSTGGFQSGTTTTTSSFSLHRTFRLSWCRSATPVCRSPSSPVCRRSSSSSRAAVAPGPFCN